MPIQPTYPGVYIEELPSGSKTVSGVATAVTAFVGRALRGPTDADGPVTIFGFGDFQATFGGLHKDYPLGYAVQDFFLNGGAKAIIVRIYKDDDAVPGDGRASVVIDQSASMRAAAQKVVDAAEEELFTPSTPDGKATVAAIQAAADKAAAGVVDDPMKTAAAAVAGAMKDAVTADAKLTPDQVVAAAKGVPVTFRDAAAKVLAAVAGAVADKGDAAAVDKAADDAVAALPDSVKDGGSAVADAVKAATDVTGKTGAGAAALATVYDEAGPAAAMVLAAVEEATPDAADVDAMKAAADTAQKTIKPDALQTAVQSVVDGVAGADKDAALASARTAAGKLTTVDPTTLLCFNAANPGAWGNGLHVSVDHDGISAAMDHMFEGITHKDLFNVDVSFVPIGGVPVVERFLNLSVAAGYDGDRRMDRVLANESVLLRAVRDDAGKPVFPPKRPEPMVCKASGGDNGVGLDTLAYLGNAKIKTGIYALEKVDLFNLLCIPPDSRDPMLKAWDTPYEVLQTAATYCFQKRAMLIMDPPKEWSTMARTGKIADIKLSKAYNFADAGRNCAIYFPRVKRSNPMLKGAIEVFPACGMIAGVMSRTDINRGVWKAPAGTEAGLVGARGLELPLTDDENGMLNPQGINCIRTFPVTGTVAWGGRTLRGADQLSDDYKYINVRRLTLYIEESLFRGTQFAVFEPNAPELWTTLKSAAESFMASLAKQGAFYSYEVVCDDSTTSARDINMGRVNLLVAFAPVKPAEFVVIQIQQQALKE